MIDIIIDTKKIKKSNIFFIAEWVSCLKKLDFLWLSSEIIEKIKGIIKEEKSQFFQFYIGKDEISTLYFLYNSPKETKSITYLIGEYIEKVEGDCVFYVSKEKHTLQVFNTVVLRRYQFQEYKSEKKNNKSIFLVTTKEEKQILQSRYTTLQNIILAKELWETPASDLTPENFAKIIKNTKFKNIKVKILSPKEVEKKWLGLLYGVWKGSINKPYLVILEKIEDKKYVNIGLAWKWIVFDTGWLDIKTQMMYDMKDDMCWAAVVFATMKELDEKKLGFNLIAALPLAENAVSWESYRPSDILKSYIWKTVNITNTDAEGRLVLSDAVWYISKNYNLESVISVATLTGACLFALGYRYAWIMWTDRKIIEKLIQFWKNTDEKYIELPFDDYYVEKTKSKIADLDNWTSWVYTGPTMWAAFIYNFLTKNEKYTHLDIAGTANNNFEPFSMFNKGTTGFWVDSLSFILQNLKK